MPFIKHLNAELIENVASALANGKAVMLDAGQNGVWT